MSDKKFLEIWETIKKQTKIDEGFYPNRNLYTLRSGGISEVKEIYNVLKENNYETSTENIISCMNLRKEIYDMLDNNSNLKEKIEQISEGKVGTGFGAEGIVSIFLIYALLRIGDAFLSEIGKDIYKKIKNTLSKKVEDDKEKEILTQIALEVIKNKEIIDLLSKIKK